MTDPIAILVPLVFLAGACSGDGDSNTPVDFGDCTAVVDRDNPVAAAQTALIEAAEGDIVCLAEGTWDVNTELSLTVNDVTIKGAGMGRTVLDFTAQDIGAQGMSTIADGTVFEDFSVVNTPGDGIRATDVNDVTWRSVEVGWDAAETDDHGAYGVYPVGCDIVRILDSDVHGARDAGVYVGQSTHILVAGNEVHDNVAGIEIENSTDAEVTDNHSHDNTAGILVFNLPGLEVGDGKRAKVHANVVESNNTPNFGKTGTIVSVVPKGIGVMVLASDDNGIADNDLTDNGTSAIAILSYIDVLMGSYDDNAYDKFAANNYFHDNRASGNGDAPAELMGAFTKIRPYPDIVWDGCQDPKVTEAFNGNCLNENGASTYLDIDFCGGFKNQTTDIATATCVGEELPGQDL